MANWCNNILEVKGSKESVARAKELIFGEYKGAIQVDFNIAVPMPKPLEGFDVTSCINDNNFTIPRYYEGRLGVVSFNNLTEALQKLELATPDEADEIIAEAEKVSWYDSSMAIEDFVEKHIRHCFARTSLGVVYKIALLLVKDNERYCSKQYGHKNWYNWRMYNWGVEWNVENGGCTCLANTPECIRVAFNTSWKDADEWFYTLGELLEDAGIVDDISVELTYAEPTSLLAGRHIYDGTMVYSEELSEEETDEFLASDDDIQT